MALTKEEIHVMEREALLGRYRTALESVAATEAVGGLKPKQETKDNISAFEQELRQRLIDGENATRALQKYATGH